ncbi:MAG: ATP-binding protein [Saprospiraceae bacterium]|nr:ATP-binding protein [Candidatus Vicinibacter affinis]
MTNVISNLLDNAVKYSKSNPEITIRTSNIKDNLIIEIEDKGIGIQAHDLDKLFQKFYRSHRRCTQCQRIWNWSLLCKKNLRCSRI